MSRDDADDVDRAKALIEAGSEIVGGGVGAAVGLLFAGPPGSIAGGAAGPVATRALRSATVELARRVLSSRERARVGSVVVYAADAYERRIIEGRTPRDDDFFGAGSRSAADEVAEGVLLTAQRQHEERKVRHLGYLLGNIAFHGEIDRHHANRLIRQTNELAYRQLCLLSLVGQEDRFTLPGDLPPEPVNWHCWAARRDLADLGAAPLQLVAAPPAHTTKGLPYPVNTPSALRLTAGGRVLFELLELTRVPEEDLTETLAVLTNWRIEDGSE